MTRGSISFENAQDSREACALKEDLVPVQRYPTASLRDRQQSGEDEVQVLLETLNADDWVKKFFATAAVPKKQRPKKFVGRGSARNYLVSKVFNKFDIFTPARDQGRSSFDSACDLALNALERAGHLRWPAEHVRTPPTPAVKPEAPTPPVNVSVENTPEFKAAVNEARRSGYSDGFKAGRVAGRAEMRAEMVLRQHFNSAGPEDSGTAHTRGLSEFSVEDAAESVDALERTSTLPKSPRGSPILEPPPLGEGLSSVSNNSRGEAQTTAVPGINTLGRTRQQTASMARKRSVSLEEGEIKTEPQAKKRNRL
ncbi:uncharacterized protein J3D65DRAFT_56303 [Phyllosticta citribraziliensis]|uniref:Uncharacterized protein n=1 Tax=Phyllosticta citribraziliensis TaxID=989973 RepID=A0ABR1LDY6_9PEZI